MSLRARLLAAAVLLIAGLVLSGFLIIRTVERSELHQLDTQLGASIPVAVGVAHAQPPLSAGRPPAPPPDRLSDTYVAVISNGQRTTLASPQATNGKQPQSPPTAATSITNMKPTTVSSLNGSGRWRAALLGIPDNQQLLVAAFMGPVDSTTAEMRTAVLVAGAIAVLILLAAGFWIEQLGLRPIARMRGVAEAILAGDRRQRVPISSAGAETADLAAALNSVLDQQQAIEDRLRQFLADASHELRTPTSVISGLTQLWRQGDLRDGEALEDAMRRIGQESGRMKGLVEELLLLARLDEGMPLHRQPVDLTAVTGDVVDDAVAANPSRPIHADIEAGVSVPGEDTALRRVVNNLVTNALRHTPPSSAVVIRLCRRSTDCLLEVKDAGPGMTADEADHAFDRFWRADASRRADRFRTRAAYRTSHHHRPRR